MILRNHLFSLFQIINFFLLTLFISFKKIFIWFKYNTGKNLRTNLFNFITLNEDKFFFKLKKISLLIALHMHLCDRADIHFLNSKKKKQSRNFIKSKKLFFDRIAMHKFVWLKVMFFESKKLSSGCTLDYLISTNSILKSRNKVMKTKMCFMVTWSR